MYKVIYEIVFNKTTERYIIQDYIIKYSNCDYIHTIDISKDIRKIFERKKLDKFKIVDFDDITTVNYCGFTQNKETAEAYCEYYNLLFNINYFYKEREYCLDISNHYNHRIEDFNRKLCKLEKVIPIKF